MRPEPETHERSRLGVIDAVLPGLDGQQVGVVGVLVITRGAPHASAPRIAWSLS